MRYSECDYKRFSILKPNKNKAIFIDRDGVLIIDKTAKYKHDSLDILDGAIEFIKQCHDNGYNIIIFTDQYAIGKGYYTKRDMHVFNNRLRKELKYIDAIYYCPHSNSTCGCNKCKIGMITQAVKDFNIQCDKSILIGDKMEDIKMGIASNIGRSILVTTGLYKNNDYKTEEDYSKILPETVSCLNDIII